MRALLIAGLIGLCVLPAEAGPDDAALAKAGLFNTTWAMNCAQPPSASNYYLRYALAPSGFPAETQQAAAAPGKPKDLRNVQFISAQWLLYSYHDTDGEMVTILTARDGDRKKSWWSVGANGKAYILNGKFVSSGREVPWFEKCK